MTSPSPSYEQRAKAQARATHVKFFPPTVRVRVHRMVRVPDYVAPGTARAITLADEPQIDVPPCVSEQEPEPPPVRIWIEGIIRAVCERYGIERMDLVSARRTAHVVLARQIGMYLGKTLTPRSLPDIGRRFGGRDHTTVLHSVRKISELVLTDQVIAAEVEALKKMLEP